MNWQAIAQQNNLSISSVLFSELNEETRLDAEYYRPEAISYLELLKSKEAKPISSVAKFVVGPFGSTVTVDKYVEETEYSYVRNLDISRFGINNSDAHISKDLFDKLPQFHIQKNDLLVTVVGTLGKVAIAMEKDTRSIFSCKSTIIRCETVDPYFLATYLNSTVGQTLLLRCKRGAIQEGLNLFDIKTLLVSLPSKDFQDKVRRLVEEAFNASSKSNYFHQEAEQLLLNELKLSDYAINEVNNSTRNLSECLVNDRFDAEFWQPKYDHILKILHKNSLKLKDVCKVIKGVNVAYEENGSNKVIKTKQLKNAYIDVENTEDTSNDGLPLLNKDILFASMGVGSLGKTDIFYREMYQGNYITDSTLFTIRDCKIKPEVILTLLRTRIYQELIYRYIVGSSGIISISKAHFENLPIPKINLDVQEKIADMVSNSLKQRNITSSLLEKAKRAVEIFIEKDEESALSHLSQI